MEEFKYTDLVIPDFDRMVDEMFENIRNDQDLTTEQMQEVVSASSAFDLIDKTLPDYIINQHDKSYLDGWLGIFTRNQQTIVNEHPEMFLYFNLFIHTTHNLFDNLKRKMNKTTVGLPDIVRMTLLGTLCRMADEVTVLLSNGSTRTALAVYRALYEHAVIGIFLMQKDEELLYRKFADYGHKDIRKKADALDKHAEKLKFSPLESERRQEIDLRTEELKKLYGNGFFEEYGWANGHVTEKRATFWAVEKDAGMERYRPFYIWASQFTHPSFQALSDIENDSGQMDLDKITRQEIGKSAFVDPMQLTANALYIYIDHLLLHYSVSHQYTINTLSFRKTLERLMKSFDD